MDDVQEELDLKMKGEQHHHQNGSDNSYIISNPFPYYICWRDIYTHIKLTVYASDRAVSPILWWLNGFLALWSNPFFLQICEIVPCKKSCYKIVKIDVLKDLSKLQRTDGRTVEDKVIFRGYSVPENTG